MVPSGPPTPIGGGQAVPPSLLRSNSGILGGQGGSLPSQAAFSSLVSPRNHYSNVNMLGNVGNISPLLNQSFPSGSSGSVSNQRDAGAEPDPLSGIGNGMAFNAQSSFMPSSMVNTGQAQGQQFSGGVNAQLLSDQQSHVDAQCFQHAQQFSSPNPQQFQALRGVVGVKMEPQVASDQQTQALRSMAQVKVEPQHLPAMRTMAPVKMESQHSDQSLYLHQQQQNQQQQFLQMSRQSSQATANMLTQQRILQLQQHHQQQLLKGMSQQRPPLTQQLQQQRPAMKPYEPGMCARRLTHYMYQQQHRPEDNNIEFWRKFVAEYFAPHAKKKWCVSLYGSGRHTTGVFPQDVWHCEICNRKPGRGFEATVEVLPRLFKIKYESGTLEELLYVDMPREYQNPSGQVVLDYAKAIQESVFEQLRVVREGQLRIVFSPDLKICSWEFCARRHEELIPRRLLIPQVSQLGAAAQKYTQNASSNLSVQELQNNCNLFVASARQLAKSLEVPLVNDLGYTKRYVRCLQISEVVNSMKDLIDYSRETGTGPMESLTKFPRRTSSSLFHTQTHQPEDQQPQPFNANPEHPSQVVNTSSLPTSTSTIVGLLHQNSRQQNAGSPYPGSAPSPGQPPANPSGSTNSPANVPALSGEADPADPQSSVQKLIHDMLMSNQLSGGNGGLVGIGSFGNDVKNGPMGNPNSGGGGGGFGLMNGMRGALANNAMANGRMGMGMGMGREQAMSHHLPQQDVGNQLLNGFNNVQFDWKSSP